jgi:type III pantothenate kinase
MTAVIASSVVPAVTQMLRYAFSTSSPRLHVVDSHSPFHFKIAASPANQVGADRLVNAEAVVVEYGAPAIIIDSGTATTICAVALEGGVAGYLGGAILPGMEMGLEALSRKAAQLYSVELVAPPSVIGGNTQDALRSGILIGYACMLDGMILKFKKELRASSADIKVIATGGVSERLKGLMNEITHYDADLTLKGLVGIYESVSKI